MTSLELGTYVLLALQFLTFISSIVSAAFAIFTYMLYLDIQKIAIEGEE